MSGSCRSELDPGQPFFETRLVRPSERQGDLELDLGGGLLLEFRVAPDSRHGL
jgi:hypothetical protein